MHGDGISGQRVWISCANKPRARLIGNYWCKVLPDKGAFRTLRREIQQGAAWPKVLANMRAEPKDTPPLSNEDHDILKHLIKQHALNPSHAFAVRQVLDESCITALTGGAGTGKSETMVACIKAVLWQHGLLVAQNPDPADRGTFNMGRKVGGPEEDTQPRACVLVTAPTNAQVEMMLARVHEECYKDSVFREKVLGDHPAPWLRLRAQRATAPPGLAPFDELKVQETLGRTSGCKATLKCALNSCRVLFATAGMVANRHKMLLGKGKEKTRFAFSFVHEASRHNIPVGLDLAAMGSQCVLCGDPGQLRPYSHVPLLASACEAEKAEVVPEAVAWPPDDTFKFNGVVRDSHGPQVHWHDSHRFCTTSTLQFFLYRTRCRASILVQQYRMTKPMATLMRALFTGGAVGHYHPSENPFPDPILNNPIRIVDLNGPTSWEELEWTLGAEDLGRMFNHVEEAWANLRMHPVLLNKGDVSMEEGLLVCHFLEYVVRRGTYLAQSVAVVTTPYAQMVWLQHCVRFVGRKWQAHTVNLLTSVATLDRFQGLQAPVILSSLVSPTPGIMHDIQRSNTLSSRAQSELHLFGRFTQWTTHPTPGVWLAAMHAVQWEAGSGTVSDTLQLAGVLREAATVERIVHGTIYPLAGGPVGHWLWKPWNRHKRARDPWGYAPGSADQLLDFERIMANTRKDEVSVRVKGALGNIVKPRLLGVILRIFTEWALPYVRVEDNGQDSGDWGGLVRVTYTSKLDLWERRIVQHLVGKPLYHKQKYQNQNTVGTYRTIALPLWQDAYSCLDSLPFLCGDFRTPVGVYVASLLHGVDRCPGTLGVCAPVKVHEEEAPQCGRRKLPHGVKHYILGRH